MMYNYTPAVLPELHWDKKEDKIGNYDVQIDTFATSFTIFLCA